MDLKSLVSSTPEPRWFHFAEDDIAGIRPLEEDSDEEPLFSLQIEYVTPRQYRALITEGLERKAISRKGVKALATNEEKTRQRICRKLVKDWALDVAGAYALELTADLGDVDPQQPIEFTESNLDVMSQSSQLSSLVNEIVTNHSRWFKRPGDGEDDEDSVGKSPSGQNGSSDAPPVETA